MCIPLKFSSVCGQDMEELVQQGRLIAPEDIFDELTDQQDDLYEWAKAHRNLFVEIGPREEDRLRKMLAAFPQLADPIKSRSCASSADQILVALAAANRYVLVSEESAGSRTKPKIQELCDLFRVERIRFLDIVKREGWTFP